MSGPFPYGIWQKDTILSIGTLDAITGMKAIGTYFRIVTRHMHNDMPKSMQRLQNKAPLDGTLDHLEMSNAYTDFYS